MQRGQVSNSKRCPHLLVELRLQGLALEEHGLNVGGGQVHRAHDALARLPARQVAARRAPGSTTSLTRTGTTTRTGTRTTPAE